MRLIRLIALPVLAAPSLFAQELTKASPSESVYAAGRAEMQTLPEGAEKFVVDSTQIMNLERIHLVPVRYKVKSDAPFYRCGIVFVMSTAETDDAARFVLTFGADRTEAESCTSLQAIGAVDNGTKFPQLALVYKGYANNHTVTEPVVLTWDGKGAYKPDADASQWISEQKKPYTIANMRELLAQRNAKKN